MPQEHFVLRCFSCETFQVHIVKKAKKWECKMCGAKQSVKRNYGKGTGKDCRNQVMKLNELRFLNDSKAKELSDNIPEDDDDDDLALHRIDENLTQNKTFGSKWAQYLEEPEVNSESEEEKSEPDFSVTMVEKKNKKRVKKMPDNCTSSNKKICRTSTSEILSPAKIHCTSKSLNQNFNEIYKNNESITKNNMIQTCTKLKTNKYTKYLENKEESENDPTKVNKISNIFDSGSSDLDAILNF